MPLQLHRRLSSSTQSGSVCWVACVAQKMHRTTLPERRGQHLLDGPLETLVTVSHDIFDALQTPFFQACQKRGPAVVGLPILQFHGQQVSFPRGVDPDRNLHRSRPHRARPTPYRLLRFEPIDSFCRASRSNRNSEAYFRPKIASPDIKQSVRFKPRPATVSSMRSKLARTSRSNPRALKVLRNR